MVLMLMKMKANRSSTSYKKKEAGREPKTNKIQNTAHAINSDTSILLMIVIMMGVMMLMLMMMRRIRMTTIVLLIMVVIMMMMSILTMIMIWTI